MLKVNDIVMLVWACCTKGRSHLGWIGIVEDLQTYEGSPCWCGYKTYGMHAVVDIGGKGIVPITWLRKIDPPIETENIIIAKELEIER